MSGWGSAGWRGGGCSPVEGTGRGLCAVAHFSPGKEGRGGEKTDHLLEVDFMRTALALDVACPPIPPFVCQVTAVNANLPPVLSLDTFSAQSDGDDLVAEADADEFEVLVRGRGGEGADELDERGDKGVGGIVRGVFLCPGIKHRQNKYKEKDLLDPVSMTQSYASGAPYCSRSSGGYSFLLTTS